MISAAESELAALKIEHQRVLDEVEARNAEWAEHSRKVQAYIDKTSQMIPRLEKADNETRNIVIEANNRCAAVKKKVEEICTVEPTIGQALWWLLHLIQIKVVRVVEGK